MSQTLKSAILEYLDSKDRSQWTDLRDFLQEHENLELEEIRSALMQLENSRHVAFQGNFHQKIGLHERLNPGDARNTYITLDNIPQVNAKIIEAGQEKAETNKSRFMTSDEIKTKAYDAIDFQLKEMIEKGVAELPYDFPLKSHRDHQAFDLAVQLIKKYSLIDIKSPTGNILGSVLSVEDNGYTCHESGGIRNYLKKVDTSFMPPSPVHIGDVIHNTSGIVVKDSFKNQGGDQSLGDFLFKSDNAVRYPSANENAPKHSTTKTIIKKILSWIISNIWTFVLYVAVGITIAYLIYKLKVPH